MNKVILCGNLGADPEGKITASGLAISNLRVATSRKFKKGEELVEETEWHRVSVFGKTAEFCNDYLRKGYKVLVEGRIQTRSWETNEGEKRFSTEIVAESVRSLTSREK